ncbi:lamin tail domain-containing protein [Haloferula sp. BvORR071]|uniref:lamin tail domain-containing protein n=1 Tax=Haloferula sp. BvORR071 TaxID=1396141 RepID=UPI002240F381|nr:lamin tail domain-containing protein [Haloferula sp. BvORR071]
MKLPPTLILTFVAFAGVSHGQLLLTEVQSNQAAANSGDFWELTNMGSAAVDISGYRWTDYTGGNSFSNANPVPNGTVIAAGESIIFTHASEANFRTWWGAGLPASVRVFPSPGGSPGLGGGDGVTFYNSAGTTVFGFTYGTGGFVRSDGNAIPANNLHAGAAAGGTATQSLVWDPRSSVSAPKYTNATGSNFGSFASATNASDIGSPGRIDKGIDLSTYVRVARYPLPEPLSTALPDGTPNTNLLAQEASGVAYNWDNDSLYIVGDGGRSVTRVSKTGQLLDTMTLALGSSPQGTEFFDTEGITYVGNGYFVFTEERDRQLVKFHYDAGTTLTRAGTQTVKLGTFNDNLGTEGVSYDRQNGGFIALKEMSPIGIFATDVDFAAGTATNGSPTTENSVDLFDPALLGLTDVADVFTLPDRRLLVLSQEDARIVNISRSGSISSVLNISADPADTLSVAAQQHEGVTMDSNGTIYVVNENGGGNINHPELWVYQPTSAPNAAPTAIAITNATTAVQENTPVSTAVKVGDVVVSDDGLGTNTLTIGGPDAAFFQITGSSLYLKPGTILDFETKTSYSITISVDDTTLGATPDATTSYTLAVINIEPEDSSYPPVVVSEVAAWASSNSPAACDWIELTNTTNAVADISGWKIDDNSNSFAAAGPIVGVSQLKPGESVILFTDITASQLADKTASFINTWFNGTAPAGLQIGFVDSVGLGLSSGGDAVNLYDASGTLRNNVTFAASSPGPVFATFDNAAALNGTAISQLSVPGVYGAFVAASDSNEIGSPGTTGEIIISEVASWASSNSPAAADWFELTNLGARPVILSGWKVDDSSASPLGGALGLNGVPELAPGESAVFLEATSPTTAPATISTFKRTWFGSNPPAGLQVGYYSGLNIGLSSSADQVNLYDPTNQLRASVYFSVADNVSPFSTFDNAAGIDAAFISALSVPGTHGAFIAQNDAAEIGSPGGISNSSLTGFPAWLALHGYPAASFNADSDGDGLSNGQEYFFGLNPNDSSDGANVLTLMQGGSGLELGFSLLTGATDVSGVLQVSTDLQHWSPALEGVDYLAAAGTLNGTETSYSLPIPGTLPPAPGTSATYLTPHTTPTPGASLGSVRFINHGLVGAGRLSGDSLDSFGETQGAASGLFITDWSWDGEAGRFHGTFNVLPDRGFNSGTIFSNYAARVHRVDFNFTPYTGAAPVAQTQITPSYIDTTKFTYLDNGVEKFTTGFNPDGTSTLFGQTVGTATAANGPGGAQTKLLSIDAEALYLFPDGSGYIGDEYGTYIARFNPDKQITGLTQLPTAAQPFKPAGTPNYDSVNPPASGRRNNQGLEGVSVTPDGKRLLALMQSALVQDTNGAQQQTRNNTRLFVYDIEFDRDHPVLVGEYVVKLPRWDSNGDGPEADRTAAQSEIVALGEGIFLMLPRDGNGLGTGLNTGNPPAPTVLKSVQLVSLRSATNILGLYDGPNAAISPAGVLNPAIVPAASTEVINMLAPGDLAKFGFNTNNTTPDSNTVNEKIEGMALVPDLSTPAPDDFFLFVANDNDFQSSNVMMLDGSGNVVSQGDGRSNAGNGPIVNDARFLAYRVTINTSGAKFFRFDVTQP